jgi:phenylalanyl-tRNA synthetase beta chain
MKVSLVTVKNLCERYKCSADLTAIEHDKLIDKIGAQLGAIEEVIDLGKKYQAVVIVKVVKCEDHPNADKLHVCLVDDNRVVKDVQRNDDGLIQVVCGADNVHEGMLAAWLPPGAIVPSTADKDPFKLEAKDFRGVISNGMLASTKELDLGDDHSGIVDIQGEYKAGDDFAETFGLKDDQVLDIENKMFTHRPDCFGILGIARELAGIQGIAFKSPDWYQEKPPKPTKEAEELKLSVKNELPELTPRFSAITMSGVKVGPSPTWLSVSLAKNGQKSINNVVDLTNFYMLMTAQPLHAYDYDKVKALSNSDAAITIRHPKHGEKIKLLGGKEIEPHKDAIMIASDQKLLGVAGIMGGSDTEVDSGTQNIILESANFNMNSVRKTSMTHGLFSESATRFTKDQSPLQCLAVLAKIVDELRAVTGGKVAGELIDIATEAITNHQMQFVEVSSDFINSRLGLKLTAEEVEKLLSNVEFDIKREGNNLKVGVPFWRTDIQIAEDIVEEVGRLYGYDHLPLELPSRVITPAELNPLLDAKQRVRERLSAAGANEVLSYSFAAAVLLEKTGQDPKNAFTLANALSPELQYYRLSLIPSLLEKVQPNLKAGHDSFALFEIGKTHGVHQGEDDEGLPKEFEFTSLVVARADKLKAKGSAYYQAKRYLNYLCGIELEYKPIPQDMQSYDVTKPYDMGRAALVYVKPSNEFLGIIGEFKPEVRAALKLPLYCAGFEVDTPVLQKTLNNPKGYIPTPNFPKVIQDISLKVAKDTTYAEVYDALFTSLDKAKPDKTIISLSPLDIFQAKDDNDHKHITLRLSLASYERTLEAQAVNKLLDEAAGELEKSVGATRI